jgi:hypothetical protein
MHAVMITEVTCDVTTTVECVGFRAHSMSFGTSETISQSMHASIIAQARYNRTILQGIARFRCECFMSPINTFVDRWGGLITGVLNLLTQNSTLSAQICGLSGMSRKLIQLSAIGGNDKRSHKYLKQGIS